MVMTPIFRFGTENNTVPESIAAFASLYFDTPRRVTNVVMGTEPLTATFQLVHGYRTYKIQPTKDDIASAFEVSVSGL